MDALGLTFTLAIGAGIALWFGAVVLIGKWIGKKAHPRVRTHHCPPNPLWTDWDFTVERRERDERELRKARAMREAS